jgi:VLRF1 release factor-like protein
MRTVLVPASRLPRWLENFECRHGAFELTVDGAVLRARAEDGSAAVVAGPFGLPVSDVPPVLPELRWGVLLVRKGGFGVAAGTTPAPVVTKVGRRHVQGRTKAGGWSQQRFARRRDNQARQAYEAAADHAYRLLVREQPVEALVCGGDRAAVDAVLADPRLAGLVAKVTEPWLAVADPTAWVLAQAVADAWSCRIRIEEPS